MDHPDQRDGLFAPAALSVDAEAQPLTPQPDWKEIVAGIEREDPASCQTLYQVFAQGIRCLMARQLGRKDLDDRVHDAFLIVLDAIRGGQIREPEKLMGFVRTIVRRQIVAHIRGAIRDRRNDRRLSATPVADNPEQALVSRERVEFMRKALMTLTLRDRELLTRFYLREQSEALICEEMRLTATQFRLFKSRAKQKMVSKALETVGKKPQRRQSASSSSCAS